VCFLSISEYKYHALPFVEKTEHKNYKARSFISSGINGYSVQVKVKTTPSKYVGEVGI
jgi:hypothetical protein